MDSLRRLKGQLDRTAAVVVTVIGGVVLVLGWFGVSGQGLTSEQIPYIVSGGLGGIFLMGVGAALWLSADLRDEWTKLDRIEKVLENGLSELGLGRGVDGRPTLAPLNDSLSVRVPSLRDGIANGNTGGLNDLDNALESPTSAGAQLRTGSESEVTSELSNMSGSDLGFGGGRRDRSSR